MQGANVKLKLVIELFSHYGRLVSGYRVLTLGYGELISVYRKIISGYRG